MAEALPEGVRLHRLKTHRDSRGSLTELFRRSWEPGFDAVQWNFVQSVPNVLRGVHLHSKHTDYLVILAGAAVIGLRDLRPAAPTYGCSVLLPVCDAAAALVIPPGVAHGFHFQTPSLHAYAVTSYWDPANELGCHWADPALGLAWDVRDPVLSERDAALPPLATLEAQYGRAAAA
jgi:dTDP-4-dehydrorhamnose 3,5-epimerase